MRFMLKSNYHAHNDILYKIIHFNPHTNTCLLLGLNRHTLKCYPVDFIIENMSPILDSNIELLELLYL